jgi:hypothetical protein
MAIAMRSDALRRMLIWSAPYRGVLALHRDGSGQAVGTKLGTAAEAPNELHAPTVC